MPRKNWLWERILGLLGVVIVLTSLSATMAASVPFQPREVFATVGNGEVQHYDKNGNLLETLYTGLGGYTTWIGMN
jgi:hypothetical protein